MIINGKFINLSRISLIIVVLILLIGNVFFWLKYSATQKELLETQKVNENLLDFAKLFITEILKAEGEIDFETRLKFENAVRDLANEEILAQWQKFTGSETEDEVQTEVKNLLELLISKIQIK